MNLVFISHGNIRTRYHCNYDGLHLNDKGASLFTENIFSALNKVAIPQSIKENPSSKSFSDSDGYLLKEMLLRQLKLLNRSTLEIYFLVI